MGKAKMLGQFKPFVPNSRADMRRRKQYRRSREYTDRHETVLDQSREKQVLGYKNIRVIPREEVENGTE